MIMQISKMVLATTVVASGLALLGMSSASAAMPGNAGGIGEVLSATGQLAGVQAATLRRHHYRSGGTFYFGTQPYYRDYQYTPYPYLYDRNRRYNRDGEFYSNSNYNYGNRYFGPNFGFLIGF